jgi:tRNA-dihydrouridine synthase
MLAPDLSLAPRARFAAMLRAAPVILAPMEDVSDALFRKLCRAARRRTSA